MHLQKKWEKTGLLEGLDNLSKFKMSQLLENEASYMLNVLKDKEEYAAYKIFLLPLVRRVFQDLPCEVVDEEKYVDEKGRPKAVRTYETKSFLPSPSYIKRTHKEELLKSVADELSSFFRGIVDNGKKLTIYEPIVLRTAEEVDSVEPYMLILFRGNID